MSDRSRQSSTGAAPQGTATVELNDRSREVLRLVVDAYVETGEPTGSRTLARSLGMAISPATIRNVMADLQDAGLLYSPHTSAGRLPTEAGLSLFVDGILQVGALDDTERRTIEDRCSGTDRNTQQLLAEATKVLSGLGNCAGLVTAPKTETRLKHVEFVSLGPGRALVVLVTEDGAVENRVIDIPLGLPPSSLVEATNFLSARMLGKTLVEAQAQFKDELKIHRRDLGEVTQRLVEAGFATWSGEGGNGSLIVGGTERLLDDVQALADVERVRALFAALETKRGLVELFEATMVADGVQIFIGAENELFGLAGCSMIIAPYANSQNRVLGAVGVIGPSRLDYGRIIPVVDYTAKVVGRLLG